MPREANYYNKKNTITLSQTNDSFPSRITRTAIRSSHFKKSRFCKKKEETMFYVFEECENNTVKVNGKEVTNIPSSGIAFLKAVLCFFKINIEEK